MRWTVICMNAFGAISYHHMNGAHGYDLAFDEATNKYQYNTEDPEDYRSVIALVPGEQVVYDRRGNCGKK